MSESALTFKKKVFKIEQFSENLWSSQTAYHGEPTGFHVNSISELGRHTQQVSKITLVRTETEVIHKDPVRYPQESTDFPLSDIALKMLSFCRSP